MQSFLRFTLLGICATVGVALAISLALTSHPRAEQVGQPSAADQPLDSEAPAELAASEREDLAAESLTDERPTAMRAEPESALLAQPPMAQVSLNPPVPVAPVRVPRYPAFDRESSRPDGESPTTSPGLAAPVIAGVQPEIASQVVRLENAIQQVEQISRQGRDVFRRAFAAPPPAAADSRQTPPPDPQAIAATGTEPAVAQRLPSPNGAQAGGTNRSGTAEVHKNEGDNELAINIQDADIRKVLDLFSQHGGLNILASKNVQGTVSATLSSADIGTALQAILSSNGFVARRDGDFVFVGTPEDFQSMDHQLDKVGTRVYRPNYVRALELQSLITAMLSPDFGTVSVSSASSMGIGANGDDAGGDDFAGSEVLLVRDYEAVLAQIDQIVDEVDQPPLQVAIEAMILSVNLDDSNEFGVSFELLRDQDNLRIISGTPLDSLAKINVTEGGLKVGFLDSDTSVFVKALENIGDTNVVASPRLMCLNKQRAEILIGSQLGYVSTTVTENAATQAVEFLEVGTQLRLRPFISSDGMIRMEVHPELSTGNVRIEEGFTLPDKEVTQVTTNIMCRDGATVVIGGLIRDDLSRTTTQIPLLGSLPIVGPVFRQKTEDVNRSEIIVLITPHIVFEPELSQNGQQAVWGINEQRKAYLDNMSPLSTRELGRKHFELALAACESGNAKAAQKHVNLAIHFDPLNMDAINFRNQNVPCWTGYAKPVEKWSSAAPLARHDGQLAPWLLDELVGPQAEVSPVPEWRGSGQPIPLPSIKTPSSP